MPADEGPAADQERRTTASADSGDVQAVPGKTFRLLFLGDICAGPGRQAVEQALPGLRQRTGADFVVANCENAAGGYGVTAKLAEVFFRAGVDCLTSGDHIYDRKEVWDYLAAERRILRPLNFPPEAPGHGAGVYECAGLKVGVINLLGRVFLKPLDCPFRRVLPVLEDIVRTTPIVLVDMHAEATAEKQGMGWFLEGKASAVIGTHTHVQTADERVLPGGTAYITDAGMCGAFDSVLGMNRDLSLRRLIELVPLRLAPATENVRLSGVLVNVDPATGRAQGITRLSEPVVSAPNQARPGQV